MYTRSIETGPSIYVSATSFPYVKNKMIGYQAFFRIANSSRDSSSFSSPFTAKRASFPTCKEPQLRILAITMPDRWAKGGSGFEISVLLTGLNQSWEAKASSDIHSNVVMVHDCELHSEWQICSKNAAVTCFTMLLFGTQMSLRHTIETGGFKIGHSLSKAGQTWNMGHFQITAKLRNIT